MFVHFSVRSIQRLKTLKKRIRNNYGSTESRNHGTIQNPGTFEISGGLKGSLLRFRRRSASLTFVAGLCDRSDPRLGELSV